ncbi:MAG TPA: hypothetical protein VHZ26_04810 [Caulobacteraceae bacterium]|jgi:hypothetical protein|nr:hypothetical protein [Caulobacteraceae bacterium]
MKDLRLNLVVEALDRATAPLRRIGAGLQALEQRTSKLHAAFTKLGLTELIGGAAIAGAAAEAGRAIWDVTNRVAEMGESLLRSSEKTGVSVEAMQRLGWAAKQLGVDADGLNHAFAMMELHVGNALKGNKQEIEALRLAGVSMKEIKALSNDPGAMFTRILDGMERIKNRSALAVAAQGLFSRSWVDMAPLLRAPREEIAALMDQLQRAHAVMTKEDAEASKKFIEAKQNMGLAVLGLGNRIGIALIPKLTDAIDKVTKWIESLNDDDVKHFTDAVTKLADQFVAMLPKIEKIIVKAVDLADKLLKLSDNTNVVKGAFIGLSAVLATQAAVALVSATGSIVSIGIASVRAAVLVASLIPAVFGLTDAMTLLDIAMDANPIGLIALAIEAAIVVIGLFIFALVELHNHWDEIVKGLEDGCRKIEKAFTDLESKMPKWLQTLLNAGGAALSIQFPALGAITRLIDGLARAPAPGGQQQPGRSVPGGRPSPSPGSPAGHRSPADWKPTPDRRSLPGLPSLSKLHIAISNAMAAPGQTHDRAAGHLPTLLVRAASPAVAPAPASQPSSSQLLGTIVVKAEQGTSVSRVEKAAAVDFRWNRGALPG